MVVYGRASIDFGVGALVRDWRARFGGAGRACGGGARKDGLFSRRAVRWQGARGGFAERETVIRLSGGPADWLPGSGSRWGEMGSGI